MKKRLATAITAAAAVFALSGWDLVGALPLDPAQVQDLMSDGDTRWIERMTGWPS